MNSLLDLDDPNKSSVYIAPSHDADDIYSSPYSHRDLPGGLNLRLEILQGSWERCSCRIQSVLHDLYAPIVSSVVSHLHHSHSPVQVLPGQPYAEVPIVCLSAPGGSVQILSEILNALENSAHHEQKPISTRKGKSRMVEPHAAPDTGVKTYVAHLHPSDCSNLISAMKAIVMGFVDKFHEDGDDSDEEDLLPRGTKRKGSTSLASYDINLLKLWYLSLLSSTAKESQLVIFLHDFEQLDPAVMQDVFHICSIHAETIPLMFLLILSSPSTPSFLHNTYSRSTLSMLRVQTVVAPSGLAIIEEIISQTFYSVDFEPDVMIGPAALEYLVDFCARHTASVDSMLTIIQLAYMKHFQDPLTHFARDALLGTQSLSQSAQKLGQPTSFNFLDSLVTRLWSDHSSPERTLPDAMIDSRSLSISSLLSSVSSAHAAAQQRARNLRLGFSVTRIISRFMMDQGYKVSSTSNGNIGFGLDLMLSAARGRLSKDLKYLGMMVRKLSGRQLDGLLSELHHYFQSFSSPQLRREEENARVKIVTAMSHLPREAVETEDHDEEVGVHPAVPPLAAHVADWLLEYVESKISRLEQGVLWDIWNTGMTPFPSELLNPAPRITIVNALLHPHDFSAAHEGLFGVSSNDPNYHETGPDPHLAVNPSTPGRRGTDPEPRRQLPLWQLPDTSILFKRYMDAGRLINVYDWYESFVVALETQRRELQKAERLRNTNGDDGVSQRSQTPRTPRTPKRGRKGKERATEEEENVNEDEVEEMTEEDVEKWRIEVQARFMRSYHDLEFMGFIKPTGRKADHVIKTIYDLPD